MSDSLVNAVWQRAKRRCEYCHLPADCSEAPFQIDHIVARKHHGTEESLNLALACYYCNTYKGPNIAGFDPRSGRLVRLFHPRKDLWSTHFVWGAEIKGLTAIGDEPQSTYCGLTIPCWSKFADGSETTINRENVAAVNPRPQSQ